MYGDGSTARDYTYIDDNVEGVVRLFSKPATVAETFDAQTRENAAYNFPCVFNIFGRMKPIDFPEMLQ